MEEKWIVKFFFSQFHVFLNQLCETKSTTLYMLEKKWNITYNIKSCDFSMRDHEVLLKPIAFTPI